MGDADIEAGAVPTTGAVVAATGTEATGVTLMAGAVPRVLGVTAGALLTGLVRVQGQLVIVRVVA